MSLDADRRQWLVSLGVALILHVAVLGLLIGWPHHPAPMLPTPMQAVMVEMAPIPTAPSAPPTAVPPGQPRHEHPRHSPVLRPHPPKLPPVPLTKVSDDHMPAAPPQEPATQPTTDPSNEVGQTTAPPSVQAAVSTHLAAPRTADATGQSTVVTWQSVLLGQLAKYRRYPIQAERARQQGIAYVRFTVDRKGDVLDAQLERSSGYSMLDQETLATVRRASPVPPPPPTIPGDRVEVVVPVVFSLRKE